MKFYSYASHWIWSGPELNSNKSYMCDTTHWGFFHGRHMRAIRWPPCLDIIQKALLTPSRFQASHHKKHGSSTASLAHTGYRQASQRYDLATCWDFFYNQATPYGPSLALFQVCFGVWEHQLVCMCVWQVSCNCGKSVSCGKAIVWANTSDMITLLWATWLGDSFWCSHVLLKMNIQTRVWEWNTSHFQAWRTCKTLMEQTDWTLQ
jgi:hypothetical protein